MNAIDNPLPQTDISLGLLLDTLDSARDRPLVLHYDRQPVRGGYHVTEVKAGNFEALDCGATPEAWSEIFVQLWDIDEDGRTKISGRQIRGDHPQGVRACAARRIGQAHLRGQRRRAADGPVLRRRADLAGWRDACGAGGTAGELQAARSGAG